MNNEPTLQSPRRAAPDTDVLSAWFPAPGLGLVPINAFVIHSKQPVLVDSGWGALRTGFLEHLASVVRVESLRWLWLTHADQDHIGCVKHLLDKAPQLRVVTTYGGMAKMSLYEPLPLDRVMLLNPGERLDVGDRSLWCLRPPTFDSPETTALYDDRQNVLFSSDSFGAVLDKPFDEAEAIGDEALVHAMNLWASFDSPWLQFVDLARWDHAFDAIREVAPPTLLSSHLPPAHGMTDRLVDILHDAQKVPPFVGPNQKAFETMLAHAQAAE